MNRELVARPRLRLAALGVVVAAVLTSACAASPARPAAASPAPSPAPKARPVASAPSAAPERVSSPTRPEADALLVAGKAREALVVYRAVWEGGARDETTLYNAACAAARADERDEAFAWLRRLVDGGFEDAKGLAADDDLTTLRAEPRFSEILASIEARRARALEPRLRDELEALAEEDQAARAPVTHGGALDEAGLLRMQAIDRKTTARMKAIIDAHGWPGRSLVGLHGAHMAWLLAQHADLDEPFQRRVLALLTTAVAAGEAEGKDLAYLTDRVLVNDGKPQRYGTQFHEVNGVQVPQPIEDADQVDARRRSVGLSTEADYARMMEQTYGKPARAR